LIVGLKLLITKGQEQDHILVPHIDSRVQIIDNERPGARSHLIPHIDSRVKIIDNERSGASPCGLPLFSYDLKTIFVF
jgi:hypothetical protein